MFHLKNIKKLLFSSQGGVGIFMKINKKFTQKYREPLKMKNIL